MALFLQLLLLEPFTYYFIRERGSFEIFLLNNWGGEERGVYADICKYTRIGNIFNQLGNKNQRSTELAKFAMHFFLQEKSLQEY